MKFEYQAIDEGGKIVSGIIDADDITKVFSIILQKRWTPMDIRSLTDATVELDRLQQLKQRLEGKPDKPVKKIKGALKFKKPKLKPKIKLDWTYLLFLLLIIGLIITATITKFNLKDFL